MRTVAYGHRGTGETKSDPASITTDALVSDLFGVMAVLEIRCCVLAAKSSGSLRLLPVATGSEKGYLPLAWTTTSPEVRTWSLARCGAMRSAKYVEPIALAPFAASSAVS